jgi:hypothetical protein
VPMNVMQFWYMQKAMRLTEFMAKKVHPHMNLNDGLKQGGTHESPTNDKRIDCNAV